MLVSRIGRQDLFDWQPSIEAGVERFLRHTKTPGPLRYRKAFPVVGQSAVVASIICLLYRRSPSAIIRFVIPIGVYAIKRICRPRALPNVLIESLEGIAPPLAYRNAAATVVFVTATRRVGTPLNHVRPNGILRCVNHSMMLFGLRPVAKAAACCGVSSSKTLSHYCYRPSAIASAQPCGFIPGNLADVSVNNQTAKPLASHVLYAFVRNGYNLVSHFRTSSTDMMRGLRGVRSALQSPLFYHNRVYGQLGQGPRIQSYLH